MITGRVAPFGREPFVCEDRFAPTLHQVIWDAEAKALQLWFSEPVELTAELEWQPSATPPTAATTGPTTAAATQPQSSIGARIAQDSATPDRIAISFAVPPPPGEWEVCILPAALRDQLGNPLESKLVLKVTIDEAGHVSPRP